MKQSEPRKLHPVIETAEEKIARLESENAKLREKAEVKLGFKVAPKGGLSVYGLGKYPVTLYRDQWESLLGYADQIREFMKAHSDELKDRKAS